jgi:hypothetical protein
MAAATAAAPKSFNVSRLFMDFLPPTNLVDCLVADFSPGGSDRAGGALRRTHFEILIGNLMEIAFGPPGVGPESEAESVRLPRI